MTFALSAKRISHVAPNELYSIPRDDGHDMLSGYMWEEDGTPAAFITLSRPQGAGELPRGSLTNRRAAAGASAQGHRAEVGHRRN